jgi:hypothetical protein
MRFFVSIENTHSCHQGAKLFFRGDNVPLTIAAANLFETRQTVKRPRQWTMCKHAVLQAVQVQD